MFCNCCGKGGKFPVEATTGMMLCRRCRRELGVRAETSGTTLKDVWSMMFRRTSRKR